MKAAYFAANDAVRFMLREIKDKSFDSQSRFSLWAVDTKAIEIASRLALCSETRQAVDIVSVPKFDNQYLTAQEGTFTLVRIDSFVSEDVIPDSRGLDEQLTLFHEGELTRDKSFELITPRPAFYKFTLPVTQAPDCLRRLEQHDVIASQ